MTQFFISIATLFLLEGSCAGQTLYGVMLDAGSSSTKLRVYSWTERSSSSDILTVTENYYQRITPSLSFLQDDLELLKKYVQNLTSIAELHVPSHSQHETNIFLLATAGIRFLEEEKAKGVMNTVEDVLSNKTLHNFKYSERSVRILSGEEEGVFAWITANYRNGTFSSNEPNSKAVGVLEMGGGSTQITFIPDGPLLAHMFSLRIAGKIYDLYSHSYLNFGKDYMDRRIKDLLIKTNPSAPSYNNSCLLSEDVSYYKTKIFRGSSSPSQCLSIISDFLEQDSGDTCYPKPCAIGSVYQPSVGADIFFATASFAAVATDLNATDASGRLDIDKLNKTAHTYCSKTKQEAGAVYKVFLENGSSTCMMALYMTELLTFSYGFPLNTTRIFPLQQYNGESLDWPLGAMVYEAELMAGDYPCSPIDASAGEPQRPVTLLYLLDLFCLLALRLCM